MKTTNNPLGLKGIAFVEMSSPDPKSLRTLWGNFGFSHSHTHKHVAVQHFVQHDIHLFLNEEPGTHAHQFHKEHGPCISALGWRVENAQAAMAEAVRRGATVFAPQHGMKATLDAPALVGIGGSLIYLVDKDMVAAEFIPAAQPTVAKDMGFLRVDHLTNNVPKGQLNTWADFYKSIFGFTEVRHFDIKGQSTGLYSFALQSPCKTFCIPINEGTDSKSQIEEYLRDYKGPGVQHLAFLTKDLVASMDAMAGRVPTLDMDDDYYATVFDRVPNVKEDHAAIRKHQILVDGDADGYLLQIFTRNIMGPIFMELIQRHNHNSFGEGNFGALFRSIERDQQRRGVL